MLKPKSVAHGYTIVKVLTCISIMCSSIIGGCMPDAERNNPYDPKSSEYRDEGILTGHITKLSQPFQGIEGVRVTLNPPKGSDITDGNGFYTIDAIPSGSYVVMAWKSGYTQDSVTVQITSGQSRSANFALNGVPYFTQTSITSEHNKSVTGEDVYFFHFDVQVDDPDGLSDIDSVIVTVSDLGFRKKLILESNTNRYSVTVFPDDIVETSLEALVGKEAVFTITDKTGHTTESPTEHLVRIIHPSPSTISPIDRDQVDPQPLLVWNLFSVPFEFTYTIEVTAFPSVWSWLREDIAPTDTSIVVSDSLDSRWSYFWAVSVVDEYGNSSQSQHVEFFVLGR